MAMYFFLFTHRYLNPIQRTGAFGRVYGIVLDFGGAFGRQVP